MKLFINKNEKYEEPEVHMFFHKQTKEVEQVEKFVRSLSITIPAKYEDEIFALLHRIHVSDMQGNEIGIIKQNFILLLGRYLCDRYFKSGG